MEINQILKRPVLTEKATRLAAGQVYMFEVDSGSNKFQIKGAIEKIYSVKVSKISIQNRKGKEKKVGRKMKVKKTPTRKIALIYVKEGKIDLFPQA